MGSHSNGDPQSPASVLPHSDQHFGCLTFAQHGDDLMILNIFKMLGIEKPSYLDLGAHDPLIISNTALLYSRGCSGVNVEANPNLIEAFKKHRPHDTNLNVGVGPEAGILKFYMYSRTSGRNTFSQKEVESLKGRLAVHETIEIPVMTIAEIVEKHCGGKYPDLLSVDIEGFDFEVLKSADFSCSRPRLIVVETRRHEGNRMIAMMQTRDYLPYCRMGENLFFVRRNDLTLVY